MQENTKKIKITYSYDGSKFLGSQTQPNKKSVEDCLNDALSHLGIFEKVQSSSRTDKNVHALNQVSTTHCLNFWNEENLKKRLNKHSHPFLHIKKIEQVDENFQVRFDATARTYRYILSHDPYNPFMSNYFNFCEKLDIKKLNLALKIFKGKHDFKAYMKTGSDNKTSIREIYISHAYRYKNFTIIKFKANGFLRSQVRMMVANAIKATRENKIEELKKAFLNKNCITKMPAPANGLYLIRVHYPH